MFNRSRYMLIAASFIFLMSLIAFISSGNLYAADVPAGVQKRIKDIDQQLDRAREGLQREYINESLIIKARELLDEIKSGYSSNAEHPDVLAAESRINEVDQAMKELAEKKNTEKESAQAEAASLEERCQQWADKLIQYKASENAEDKGYFGAPSTDADKIIACKPAYLEAKAVLEEYKATGLSENDSWVLRDPEYNIKVSIENYEESIKYVINEANQLVDQGLAWLDSQKAEGKMNSMAIFQRDRINESVIQAKKLLSSDDPQLTALDEKHQRLTKRLAEIDAILLAKIRVKPDVYKGKDAAALKSLAKKIVMKENPKAKILRVSVTKKTWEKESVIEWSDTTRTALQHRTTVGMYVQVAAKQGTDVFLYTLFLNKNNVGGSQGGLIGHIMYKDRMLEKNVMK